MHGGLVRWATIPHIGQQRGKIDHPVAGGTQRFPRLQGQEPTFFASGVIISVLPDLPIRTALPDLRSALEHQHAVLAAPPGSGKTTIVPLALRGESWLAGQKILVLTPRRLAARMAAHRMASLLGESVGQTVGYQIRFDRRIGPDTRIEVLTEGLLTRRLQTDASLFDVGLIIFDEFHERSLQVDLALALCLDLCQLRSDLRLLVMSATLDAGAVAALLGGAPIITATGQQYPVQIDYLEREPRGRIATITAMGIRRLVQQQAGDILAFLPGTGEIRQTELLLRDDPPAPDLVLAPLYGDLSAADQDRAILPDPHGRRRIILATSIAETSLTIEGISGVVDSGWSRLPAFDPESGLNTLHTVRVAKAAADQRAGRAGRLGPGVCLRLWTPQTHHSLPAFHPPEILVADLAPLVLELAQWGLQDPTLLPWLNPPRNGPFAQAQEVLRGLLALDHRGRITVLGRRLAALPLHPRLGHLLLMAHSQGQTALGCDLAALLSERDPLGGAKADTVSLESRLKLLHEWRLRGDGHMRRRGIAPEIFRRIDQAAGQYQRLLPPTPAATSHRPDTAASIGSLLTAAYPDRVAQRRPGQRGCYLLATGREVQLAPEDPLNNSAYLNIPLLDGGQRHGRAYLAETVELATLRQEHGHLCTVTDLVEWDDSLARVTAVRRESLGMITIAQSPLLEIDPAATLAAMVEGVKRRGLAVLPWNREARQLQARILCLGRWQPEGDWPDLSEPALTADWSWLAPYLDGCTRIEHLGRLQLTTILSAMLSWELQQKLAKEAPETYPVPSGARIRIDYQMEGPPILAVRIQEMFGLTTTPAICGGTLPLLLHLLSPARRPIQVTGDLAGFWQRGYPVVKKELKGRYPKHFWPDDPLTAPPTQGVRRRTQAGK